MRSPERLTVPIVLNRFATRPLHEQLVDELRRAIERGLLPTGRRLPSTRTLARVLGISRGVAMSAYQELYAEGAVHTASGSGTYVCARTSGLAAVSARPVHPDLVDLRPGQAGTEGFPLAAWRAAWREAAHDPPAPGHPPARGLPDLRAAVADHVRRMHSYAGGDHEVIITSGSRHALRVLLAAIGAPDPGMALADPSPRWWRDTVARAVAVSLDADGIRVDRLPGRVDGVVVAPDGSLPWGTRTSQSRRAELAEWSARTGGWLVEIGCNAPADPLARPLPGLLALGPPDRTALIGDLGELLTPAIGLGYLVLPAAMANVVAGHIAAAADQPVPPCQRAAAELFRGGTVSRRAEQLAATHARKIAVVRDVLDTIAGVEVPETPTLGSATVLLPDRVPADRLTRTCCAAGVLLTPLHGCYQRPQTAPNGLVIGIGHLPEEPLRAALRSVAREIQATAASTDRVA